MPNSVYTYEYSQEYIPPMPIVEVGISDSAATEPDVVIPMLVDSGSDGTIIPSSIIRQTNAMRVDSAYIRGVLGHRQKVDLYMVRLYIDTFQIPAVQVAVVEHTDEAILGRDVLNQLEITLSGSASVTEIRR